MKRIVAGLLLLLTAFSSACYWDYDTLSEEAKGKLDVVDALVGRVRRFPPIYYEKRIEINEPKARQGDFDAYDNVAVAYSRLGKQDEAIKWIREKRAAMKASPAQVTDDIRYRTESNEGTFWLVKWLSADPAKAERRWLEDGRTMIASAIKINPNAHFGREQVQLNYMDWCLNREEKSFGTYMVDRDEIEKSPAARLKMQEGLVGLIMLGAAWENPHIIGAVATRTYGGSGSAKDTDSTFVSLANLRISELTGLKVPQLPQEEGPWATSTWQSHEKENIELNFKLLRENAKQYQAHLAEFVTERVKEGKHPDKDGDSFWTGYQPTPRAEFKDPPFRIHKVVLEKPLLVLGIVLATLIGGIILTFLILRGIVRRVRARANVSSPLG